MSQLRMCYFPEYGMPSQEVIPEGYSLHSLKPEELDQYLALRPATGFSPWTRQDFEAYTADRLRDIPDGVLVITNSDGRLVAAASAESVPKFKYPFNGNLGWVMCHPDCRGLGLGKAVCIAATRKILANGFKQLTLLTDDFREPAVAIYLKIGWHPCFHEADMPGRWAALFEKLHFSTVEPVPVPPPAEQA